jgi:hypothetical protein
MSGTANGDLPPWLRERLRDLAQREDWDRWLADVKW